MDAANSQHQQGFDGFVKDAGIAQDPMMQDNIASFAADSSDFKQQDGRDSSPFKDQMSQTLQSLKSQSSSSMLGEMTTQNLPVHTQLMQHIKEHYQKFQNATDKKVTIHLRESGKNLTMIFNMEKENHLSIIFRTTDPEWHAVLQENASQIENIFKETAQQRDTYDFDMRLIGD